MLVGFFSSIKISRKSFFAEIRADKIKKYINGFTTSSWGRFVKFIQNTGQKELFDIFSPHQTHDILIDKAVVKSAISTTTIFLNVLTIIIIKVYFKRYDTTLTTESVL